MTRGRANRREFPVAIQLAIIQRATDDDGKLKCERCGSWCKSRKDFQIDHIIAEGLRPAGDKKHRLKAIDGQALCLNCHGGEKTPRDVGYIATAKRREAKAAGIEAPGKQKIGRREKPAKKPLILAAGMPGLMRRYK